LLNLEKIMYAVVKIAGKQFRVEKDTRVKVPLLSAEPGKHVHFDQVLLFQNEQGELAIGNPVLEKINVSALVLKHGREKKVIVYHKKRRKGYQRKKGHRQDFTLLEITDIGTGPRLEKKAESTREVKPVDIEKAAPVEAKDKPASAKKTEHKPAPAKTKTVREIKKTKTPDIKKKTTAEKKPAPAKKVTDKKKPAGNKK
jgi:large subunit ribosomal protein L21